MKRIGYLWVLMLFLFASCGTSKRMADTSLETRGMTAEQVVSAVADKTWADDFLTAKMKFSFKNGSQEVSVGGNLRMKKDEVIQLSLVALGIMEAARLEFTPQDVLVIDRLNKRYIRTSYAEFDFLKEAGIDFNTLQSLFRNSIFLPENRTALSLDYTSEGDAVVVCRNPRLTFKFFTSSATSMVRQTQVLPSGKGTGEMDWIYGDFTPFNGCSFPLSHQIKVKGLGKDTEVLIQLRNLGNDSKWETHTKVKSSYRLMKAADILKMLQF